MVIYTLALLAGICCFQFIPQLPPMSWICVPASVAAACSIKAALRPLAVFLLAFSWVWLCAFSNLSDRLPDSYSGRDLLLQGYISGIPAAGEHGSYRFLFITDRIQPASSTAWTAVKFKIRLRWYRDAPDLKAGERWQLRVRLKPPHGLANPGGFDYERWLFSNRIHATGYVKNSNDNGKLFASPCCQIDYWRQKHSLKLASITKPEVSGFIRALAVGDKSGIEPEQWEMLRVTGTAHLMAISGLHIGLVSGLLFAATRRIWTVLHLVQYCPATRAAALAAILGAFVYSIIGGFALPTQRALVMVTVFMSAYLFNLSIQPWRALCISLILILLADPLSVLTPGFWLSFGAVAWIFYVLAGRHGQLGRFNSAIRIQAVLALGLLPVLLLEFQQASFTAPVANLVVVPLVGLIIVPLLLLGSLMLVYWPSTGTFLIQFAATVLEMVGRFLAELAVFPAGVWQQNSGGPVISAGFVAAALLVIAPAGLAVRFSGLLLLAPLVFAPADRPQAGLVWLDLLDAGQGLAAVVRTEKHTLVYDTGPRSRSGFDTGRAVVAPFLINQGIKRIDRLIISHSDNDHQGGGRSLFEMIEVDSILAGMPEAVDFAYSNRCIRKQRWNWDGVLFEVLSPYSRTTGNNASCVLKITTADNQRLLLTGDIEAVVERQLVQDYGTDLQAQVIVAPHHGSRTSSTDRFVEMVDPDVVLFPAGFRNRFGFPKPDIMARYSRSDADTLVTGQDGAIRVMFTGSGKAPLISAFRRDHARYWRNLSAD